MDTIIQAIINNFIGAGLVFVVLPALVIGILVEVLRLTVEDIFPKIIGNIHYSNLVLPGAPFVIGLIFFIFGHFGMTVFALTFSQYMIAAGLSSFAYRLGKDYISKLISQNTSK
jgi:hypothetical protein